MIANHFRRNIDTSMPTDLSSMSIADVVEAFGMERHHAAGWFAPHYSDSEIWGRPNFSSIYYLLAGDEPLPRRKLDGIEVWHFHAGAPAEFTVGENERTSETSLLGIDIAAGQRPQLAVPAYFWQSARSLGSWTLFGCTMSPGYSQRTALVLDASD